MTAGQMIPTFDPAEGARFDDDGAPARLGPRPLRTVARTPAPDLGAVVVGDVAPRLAMTPVLGRGPFDGVWWPRTLRLADELPGLIAALASVDDTIYRVSVNGDAWSDIPSRLPRPVRPAVRVSWYRTLDPHVVTVGGETRPPIRLLVIPPDTAAGAAGEMLRSGAAGRLSGPPNHILYEAGATSSR